METRSRRAAATFFDRFLLLDISPPLLSLRLFLSAFVFFDGTRSSTILEIFFFFFLKLVYRENLSSFFFEKFVEKGKNFEFQGEIKSICDVR